MGDPTLNPSMRFESVCRGLQELRLRNEHLAEKIKILFGSDAYPESAAFAQASSNFSPAQAREESTEQIEGITLEHHYKTQRELVDLIVTGYRLLRLHRILGAHPEFLSRPETEQNDINACNNFDRHHVHKLHDHYADQTNYLKSLWGGVIYAPEHKQIAHEQAQNLEQYGDFLQRTKNRL